MTAMAVHHDPAGAQEYDATPYLPHRGGLPAHRKAAADCGGCPLHEGATQTVFGTGEVSARLVLVGEQPGDQEDRQGVPFVGPAGGVLHRALDEAGLDMAETYLTNAVKHFKFTSAGPGGRRIHKPPTLREVAACRPWLSAELRLVDPEVIVALGATAAKALFGPSFRVTKDRGAMFSPGAWDGGKARALATIHPSAVLRSDEREAAYAGLVSDLRVAAAALRG